MTPEIINVSLILAAKGNTTAIINIMTSFNRRMITHTYAK